MVSFVSVSLLSVYLLTMVPRYRKCLSFVIMVLCFFWPNKIASNYSKYILPIFTYPQNDYYDLLWFVFSPLLFLHTFHVFLPTIYISPFLLLLLLLFSLFSSSSNVILILNTSLQQLHFIGGFHHCVVFGFRK